MKLSVVMIVKDEEAILNRCLMSMYYDKDGKRVPIWDELVVCDTGSTDKTKEIAAQHGAKIVEFPWNGNMSDARNYAESQCSGEWIYMQDADEVLLEGHEKLRAAIEHDNPFDGVRPKLIFSRDDNGEPVVVYYRQEMLHRNDGTWTWEGACHEANYSSKRPLRLAQAPWLVVEQLERPGGDRPNWPDYFEAQRMSLKDTLKERFLYYLAREHINNQHYQEGIGLIELLLRGTPEGPAERSQACVLKGWAYENLHERGRAIESYLEAIKEFSNWAEPYFALGTLYYNEKDFRQAASWLYASLLYTPNAVGSHVCDASVYAWRRYDQLAVCLYHLGEFEDALKYGKLALAARPDDMRIRQNVIFTVEAMSADPTGLFGELNIETISSCNRKCVTCLRQNYLDKDRIATYCEKPPVLLPAATVRSIIDQAADMGFGGTVCLQHFDEPLMDRRIAEFGRYARSKNCFSTVWINSNGDLITEKRAKTLDGAFDLINVAMYDGFDEKKAEWLTSLFSQTKLSFTDGSHLITHYSTYSNLNDAIDEFVGTPCERECRMRCIINHKGEMQLCCDDIGSEFDLGNVNDTPLRDLWFSEKHMKILETLSKPGGRRAYPYCSICPRPFNPYRSQTGKTHDRTSNDRDIG